MNNQSYSRGYKFSSPEHRVSRSFFFFFFFLFFFGLPNVVFAQLQDKTESELRAYRKIVGKADFIQFGVSLKRWFENKDPDTDT
jgi:hypothetical protein